MLFNSLHFALFLPVVFVLYWVAFSKHLKLQNVLLVLASYYFYACWNWRFLSLIVFSTLVDYTVGLALAEQQVQWKRRFLLWMSVGINLGVLVFFKYYNFFVQSFIEAFSFLGIELHVSTLRIILPVGISFYTFQTLSYTIDVYRRKLSPIKDIIAFAGFVSFFPQLVAGPIERASNLLPQFQHKRTFSYPKAVDGMRQILWGLFKKIVVADSCAEYVQLVFDTPAAFSGSTLLVGAVFFAFQIYGDFSGYSDIAIGTARLFGFELKQNFAFPYFSRDIAEYWRRWHISLTTWFRDYLYIPLGGSRVSNMKTVRNVCIIFLISGFWHGANWTFLVWGGLNALYFIPLLLTDRNRNHLDTVAAKRLFPSAKEILQITSTFGLTVLAWIFFRADSLSHAKLYLSGLFRPSLFSVPSINPTSVWLSLAAVIFVEWIHREQQHGLQFLPNALPQSLRWSVYVVLFLAIALHTGNSSPFIYFQF